jgi:hypothetical protein
MDWYARTPRRKQQVRENEGRMVTQGLGPHDTAQHLPPLQVVPSTEHNATR